LNGAEHLVLTAHAVSICIPEISALHPTHWSTTASSRGRRPSALADDGLGPLVQTRLGVTTHQFFFVSTQTEKGRRLVLDGSFFQEGTPAGLKLPVKRTPGRGRLPSEVLLEGRGARPRWRSPPSSSSATPIPTAGETHHAAASRTQDSKAKSSPAHRALAAGVRGPCRHLRPSSSMTRTRRARPLQAPNGTTSTRRQFNVGLTRSPATACFVIGDFKVSLAAKQQEGVSSANCSASSKPRPASTLESVVPVSLSARPRRGRPKGKV